jgi:hypothetical protein
MSTVGAELESDETRLPGAGPNEGAIFAVTDKVHAVGAGIRFARPLPKKGSRNR